MRNSITGLLLLALAADPSAAEEPAAQAEPIAATPFFTALSVRDLESSKAWYERTLGFAVAREIDGGDRGFRIALLSKPGAALELVEVSGSRALEDLDPPIARRQHLQGVFKIGFRVPDLDRALRRLEALGIPLRGRVITETDGKRSAQITDPDGNIIQLFQLPGSDPAPAGRHP